MAGLRPLPALRSNAGWRDVPIEPVAEPLVPVAGIGPRVREDPAYHRMGVAGALPACWLRAGVAERLAAAADSLPAGIGLLVWDGYRPYETQKAIFDTYLAELIAVHPDWPYDALEAAAARYVTPPTRSILAPPPHLSGGAVDLTLVDAAGRPLDLGTGFDSFVPEAAATALEDRPGPVCDNRRLLYWAMADQGFTAYSEEWWHFDHGDQFWGLITGRPARYGPATPPGPG